VNPGLIQHPRHHRALLLEERQQNVLDVELIVLVPLQDLLTRRKRLLGLISEFLEIHVSSLD